MTPLREGPDSVSSSTAREEDVASARGQGFASELVSFPAGSCWAVSSVCRTWLRGALSPIPVAVNDSEVPRRPRKWGRIGGSRGAGAGRFGLFSEMAFMHYASGMRTTIDIDDPLLERVRELMRRRQTTLRALVEEGLERVLQEQAPLDGFEMRDASFDGPVGFAPGAGPKDVAAAIRELNEPS